MGQHHVAAGLGKMDLAERVDLQAPASIDQQTGGGALALAGEHAAAQAAAFGLQFDVARSLDQRGGRVARRVNRPARLQMDAPDRCDTLDGQATAVVNLQVALCPQDHLALALHRDHAGGRDVEVVGDLQRHAEQVAAVFNPLAFAHVGHAVGAGQRAQPSRRNSADRDLAPHRRDHESGGRRQVQRAVIAQVYVALVLQVEHVARAGLGQQGLVGLCQRIEIRRPGDRHTVRAVTDARRCAAGAGDRAQRDVGARHIGLLDAAAGGCAQHIAVRQQHRHQVRRQGVARVGAECASVAQAGLRQRIVAETAFRDQRRHIVGVGYEALQHRVDDRTVLR